MRKHTLPDLHWSSFGSDRILHVATGSTRRSCEGGRWSEGEGERRVHATIRSTGLPDLGEVIIDRERGREKSGRGLARSGRIVVGVQACGVFIAHTLVSKSLP